MEHFAGYGFNKSHSTAYAFLAYQTAYLKANYPWHFAAALLTIEAQNTDKLALYLGECRERGIPVLPPDINESQLRFTVEPGKGVRFGLTAIKNVGEGAIESLLAVRATQGRITSLHALCEDLDLRLVNKRVFESLVKAGAFDSLGRRRRRRSRRCRRPRCAPRLFAAIDAACEHGARAAARPERGAGAALRRRRRADATAPARTGMRRCPTRRRGPRPSSSAFEKETLGLYWSGHPVDRYADELKEFGARTTGELADAAGRRPARRRVGARRAASRSSPTPAIGGIVAACRQLKTRKGDRMAVFTLEDAQGGVEVIVFPETFQRSAGAHRDRRAGARPRQARARRRVGADPGVRDRADRQRARAAGARGGDPRRRCRPTAAMFEALGEVFSRHRGDRRVSFEIELPAAPRAAARAGRRLVADSRPAVAGARRRSRADRAAPGAVSLR